MKQYNSRKYIIRFKKQGAHSVRFAESKTEAIKTVKELQRKPRIFTNIYFEETPKDYFKNPTNTQVTRCRKILAEQEREAHKPTISHYRDMENPSNSKQLAYLKARKAYTQKPSIKTAQAFLTQIEKVLNNNIREIKASFGYIDVLEDKRIVKSSLPAISINPTRTTRAKNPSNSRARQINAKLQSVVRMVEKYRKANFTYAQIEKILVGKANVKQAIEYVKNKVKNPTKTTARNPIGKAVNPSISESDFTRIDNDTNGNPRYVLHFLRLADSYEQALKIARRFGGKKYHTKSYGGGIVFQSYNVSNLASRLNNVSRNPISKAVKNPRIAWEKLVTYIRRIPKNQLRNSVLRVDEYAKKIGLTTSEARHLLNEEIERRNKQANFTTQDYKKHIAKTVTANSKMFQGAVIGGKTSLVYPNGTASGQSRLGELKQIIVRLKNKSKATLKFPNGAFLTMDARKNLHIGGKTKAAILINGIKVSGNGLAELGTIEQIDYVTAKKHINGGKQTYYYHKLGEATGEKPRLMIDTERLPIIHGGNYDVWKVGIVN